MCGFRVEWFVVEVIRRAPPAPPGREEAGADGAQPGRPSSMGGISALRQPNTHFFAFQNTATVQRVELSRLTNLAGKS